MAGSSADDIKFNMGQLQASAANLRRVIKASEAGGKRALEALGLSTVNRLTQMLNVPAPPPSEPGQPPHRGTGQLIRSYAYKTGTTPIPYVDIGSSVKYAAYLEFGTSKMKARPHLRVAINETSTVTPKIVAAAIERTERLAAGGK